MIHNFGVIMIENSYGGLSWQAAIPTLLIFCVHLLFRWCVGYCWFCSEKSPPLTSPTRLRGFAFYLYYFIARLPLMLQGAYAVGCILDIGLPTASFIAADVECSIALFAYLQLLMIKLGRENTMQLTGEIQFQTSIITSPAPFNQAVMRLFPERFRYLFPVFLLGCIYQYIVLKPIFTISLCSIEFVAKISYNSTSWVVLQVFAQFSLLIMFLAATYIYGALRFSVPEPFGWALACFALCLLVPHLTNLFAMIPIFQGDPNSRQFMALLSPMIAGVLLLLCDVLYGFFHPPGDAWLPVHLASVGLNTEGEEEESEEYSVNTVFVVEASDSEQQGRIAADPSDSESERYQHASQGPVRQAFGSEARKRDLREMTESDPLVEPI